MNMKRFFGAFALISVVMTHSVFAQTESMETKPAVEVQLIRNATVKMTYANTTFLIDPMLSPKGTYPGFENTFQSALRNPRVELPMSVEEVLKDVDAVIVTHTHLDHWDDAAQAVLPKDMPLFTQNDADMRVIQSQGFTNVRVLDENTTFNGVSLHKTGGQHGSDAMYSSPELARFLGEAMGIVFEAKNHKTVYVAGDTIWRPEVEQTIAQYHPDIILLNAGNALIDGFQESIIMGKEDMLRAYNAAPNATILAVHMDAINHMALTRKALAEYTKEKGIQDRVLIPADGEMLMF